MNFSKLLFSLALIFSFFVHLHAQNPPVFDVPLNETVIVNSGQHFILLPNVGDGDSTAQELSFEVASSDNSILQIDSVSYSAGDKMAVVWVRDNGILGTVVLSVEISDNDGKISEDFEVEVAAYPHHGIKFEIHDAVFWQEVVPLDDTPIYSEIAQSTNMKSTYDNLNWDEIPLTVSAGCGNATLCDGHDFSTGFIEGFLVPEKSGNYNFYISGDSDYALFLSSDENFENAEVIAAKSDNHGDVGSSTGGRKSGTVALDSGKVYAIYAAQWNVHNENGGVKWELSGDFGATYIDGDFLYPEWDTKRPGKIENLSVASVGDRFARIVWSAGSDDQKLVGYNVYLNGIKVNEAPVQTASYLADSLEAGTSYTTTVTAVDKVNNESLVNEIISFETLELDTNPPTPPTTLTTDVATGLALQVSWEGATDTETEIFGYNVYLDGELYNTDSTILSNSVLLKVFEPNTAYNIEIEAIDAGMNVSVKSEVFVVSTSAFDPLAENLGLQTGRFSVSDTAMSYNEGIGINPDYKSGDVFNNAHTILLNDLQPGAIRWGALTANPLSFSDYAGVNQQVTIGKFMKRCNQFDAYTTFCCGVENSTDWREDPETFIRFLEYINGPDDTPGGQLRVKEGLTEPPLQNSPGLIFEFGNEVWGGSGLHNAQIGEDYNEYAKWCREIAEKMKASAYYDSTKIVLVYSARYPSMAASYGLNQKLILGDDDEVDWLGPSGYLGGNLDYDPELPPAESELQYYENVRDRANDYLNGMVASHKYEVEKTGFVKEQYMYESNTTTPTYNGRLGQALLSTDYYISAMELGSAIPTIFHLTGGQWRITEPENNYRRLPLFITAKYFNRFCKGDVLDNLYNSNIMGESAPGATFAERPVGAHAYRNEDGYSVVFISRNYEEDHYVELDLPDELIPSGMGKMYVISGEDFNTKNATIDSTEITVEDEMLVTVPKHAMVLIHFEAENIETENLPLAYFPYPRMEKIEITPTNFSFSEPGESQRFDIQISPADSWDQKVEWQLLNNSGNYGILDSDTYCFVYSSTSLDNAADSLILQATSRNGEVQSEVVIHLPGATGAVDIENSGVKIYPNPARENIYVELTMTEMIRIYSVDGIKVLEKELTPGSNTVGIGNLSEGLYTVQIGGSTERLIKRN